MTATSSRLIRYGRYMVIPADGTLVYGGDEPNIWGHITRAGLRVQWLITAEKTGRVLAAGRAWTRDGAWTRVAAAAHTPGILGRAGGEPS